MLAGLDAIAAADSNFDGKHFLTGARAAYEMIVNAYAEGDRRTLKNLLAREVYDGFESAIAEREKRGETVESRFVSIDNADITAAELRGRNAQVTVRFQSKLVSVTRDKDGKVIDGNAEKVTDITDVWTFARDVSCTRSELEIDCHRSRTMSACRSRFSAHSFDFALVSR